MTSSTPFQETISFLLAQVAKSHRHKAGQLLAEIELHPGQEILLKTLGHLGSHATHGELADELNVKPATVSRMIDRLEQYGLVMRCKDENDQRVSLVHLTETGQSYEVAIDEMWSKLEEITTANFTAEERLILRRLLMQIFNNLNAE